MRTLISVLYLMGTFNDQPWVAVREQLTRIPWILVPLIWKLAESVLMRRLQHCVMGRLIGCMEKSFKARIVSSIRLVRRLELGYLILEGVNVNLFPLPFSTRSNDHLLAPALSAVLRELY